MNSLGTCVKMNKNDKILVAGATGMVGSAIVRNLRLRGYTNILTPNRKEVDFTNQQQTRLYMDEVKPDYVFLAAARVGGILDNAKYTADYIRDNLFIQTNLIDSSYNNGAKKLLFLGSSCIYPKHAKQPMTEDQLLSSYLEPTNQSYALAKISGIQMCQAYHKQYGFNAISLMPTNLYGPNDNFDHNSGHVLPAMISKFSGAMERSKHYEVTLWGDGSARREFLHVDDLAEACHVCMQDYDIPDIINVGTGEDVTIKELAEMVADVVKYHREIKWDITKPNGTPRKLLDVSKIKSLGWSPKIKLEDGIRSTYEWYKENE